MIDLSRTLWISIILISSVLYLQYYRNQLKEKFENPRTVNNIFYGAKIQIIHKESGLALANTPASYKDSRIFKDKQMIGNTNGSSLPSVFLEDKKNKNITTWTILRPDDYNQNDKLGKPITNRSTIRIQASGEQMSRNRMLHIINGMYEPVFASTNLEVSVYGDPNTGVSNSNSLWNIEWSGDEGNLLNNMNIQLKHKNTNTILTSFGKKFIPFGNESKNVVTTTKLNVDENIWSIELVDNVSPYLDKCSEYMKQINEIKDKQIPDANKITFADKRRLQLSILNQQLNKLQKQYNQECLIYPYQKYAEKEEEHKKQKETMISEYDTIEKNYNKNFNNLLNIKSEQSSKKQFLEQQNNFLIKNQCPPYRKCLNPISKTEMKKYESVCASNKNEIIQSLTNNISDVVQKYKNPDDINRYSIEEHPDFKNLRSINNITQCHSNQNLSKMDVTKHPQFANYIKKSDIKTTYNLTDIPDMNCYVPISDLGKPKKVSDFTIQEILNANNIETFENLSTNQCVAEPMSEKQKQLLQNLGFTNVLSNNINNQSNNNQSINNNVNNQLINNNVNNQLNNNQLNNNQSMNNINEYEKLQQLQEEHKEIQQQLISSSEKYKQLNKMDSLSMNETNIKDKIQSTKEKQLIEINQLQTKSALLKKEIEQCNINMFPIQEHKDYSQYIRRDQIPCWGCKV